MSYYLWNWDSHALYDLCHDFEINLEESLSLQLWIKNMYLFVCNIFIYSIFIFSIYLCIVFIYLISVFFCIYFSALNHSACQSIIHSTIWQSNIKSKMIPSYIRHCVDIKPRSVTVCGFSSIGSLFSHQLRHI